MRFWLSGSVVMLPPRMRGPTWWPLGFFTVLGLTPRLCLLPILFPLNSFWPSSFLSRAFACLDCPSWLLVSGWPDCWFCWYHVTQGRLRDLQILLSASLVFELCATLLCGKFSLKLWWLRPGFYLENLVFLASRQETHWSLLKVAHDFLYNAHRLVSFGLNVPPDFLCGHSDETLEHLFFHWSLTQSGLDWILSILFLSSPLAPAITVRHVLFGFSSDELLCVPRVFCYLLSLLKFFVWCQRNDHRFRSKRPSAVVLIASIKGRLSFYLPLLFKRLRSRRRLRFSNASGEPITVSVRSFVTLFISIFLSVVRVCLTRSPLCS